MKESTVKGLLALLILVSLTETAGSFDLPTNRGAEPSSDNVITGIPWEGEKGIRETFQEIIARQSLTPQRSTTRVLPFRPIPNRDVAPQNPDSPNIPQWPITHGPRISTSITPYTPQTLSLNFLGATLADTLSFPPDTMGAAGPTQYIVAVNGRIRSFNKTTGVADGILNVDTDVFFSSVMTPPTSNNFTTDPRIRYDRLSGRWFIIMIDVPGEQGALPNRVMIAVSSGDTITSISNFTFFYFEHDLVGPTPNVDTGYFADYPTLGIDANALYIGVNIFTLTGGFSNTTGFVVRKSSILGAGPIVVTAFRGLITTDGPFTPQGVDNYDPVATEGYFIGVSDASFGRLILRRVSDPGGTPSISGNINITVNSTSFPLNVPNKDGTKPLHALDDRLFAAHIRNGNLWTAHNIRVDNSGIGTNTGDRDGTRWYELAGIVSPGTPSVIQSGTVFDSAALSPRFYWIPSIMVSGQGHAALGFSTAGTNEYANAATVGRLAGDALGTMETPALYTASITAYNPAGDNSRPYRRWGDYSYTSLDPNDDMTMWTIQEFCNATNSYGVQVVKLLAPPPAMPFSASPSSVATGQSSVNVTITGTQSAGSGFFDPGSGFPNRISASVSGGVAVNSVTYTDPTHVTLDISTVSASAGSQNVMVTNPDEQSKTGNGILTITSALISISPTSKNFGMVQVGVSITQSFTISSTGSTTLSISATFLSGGNSAMFSVTPGTCPSITPTINAGQSCTINVTFTPTSVGTKSTTLVIISNASNSATLNVSLSGTGIETLTVAGAAGGSTGTVTGGSSINCIIAANGSTSGVCSESESVNSVVLTAFPASGAFTIWSGCTTGSGNTCNVTTNADRTVTAGFSLFPVKREENGTTVAIYSTIQAAFDAAVNGDIIETQATTFNESPDFNLNAAIPLKGGFDATFTSQIGYSTIAGVLTISNGTVIVENIIIQ